MAPNAKLFRAIVVLGAAMTASACTDSTCARCVPTDAIIASDTPVDAGQSDGPVDADVSDVILIL